MSFDPKKPVSLEDLLHLKRSERPPEQFWVEFESELRVKQLAAIVERRPWWSSWERISQVMVRQSVPIGASAALALGLVSFHAYRSRGVNTPMASVPQPAMAARLVGNSQLTVTEEPVASADVPESAPSVAAAPTVRSAAVPAAAVKSAASASSVAMDSGSDPFSALEGSPRKVTPLASQQSDSWSHFGDQQLATNSLATTVGFTSHVYATPVSEPLAQMSTPVDERQAMLLSGSLPRTGGAADDDSVVATDERVASRISDERLYQALSSRLKVGGNRLSISY